jgi:hypothetical protein
MWIALYQVIKAATLPAKTSSFKNRNSRDALLRQARDQLL